MVLEAPEALPLARRSELCRVNVAGRIVRGGVRRAAERHRLDELRPLSGLRRRYLHGVAHRERVRAIDAHAVPSPYPTALSTSRSAPD